LIVFLVTLHQILYLKKGVKILGYVIASLAGLLLLLWLLIRIPAVQTRLVHYATFQASKTLKTEIKIGSVDFSPFNRFYINEMLVRDQSKDTLLYVGSLKLKITDWFFVKDKVTIHYFGLANAYINTKRTDSTWNYNFLIEAFASDKQTANQPSNIALDLKEIELDNIRYHTTDKWRGEDQLISLKSFTLSANQIDIKNNKIALNKILIEEPYFKLNQYEGLRPDSLIPITEPRVEGKLHWNPEQWKITAKSILLKRGEFKSDLESNAAPLPYFDGEHINFQNINGSLNNFSLVDDTLSAQIMLSTKERSGFEVVSLIALMKMDPTEMSFKNLDIKTPYSKIGHSFSMKYKNFTDDMAEFVTNVNLEGDIRESVLDFRDLAFFAPQLKGEKIKLKLDGEVNGPVADLFADNIELDYGEHTFVRGDLHITGLPDTDIAEYKLDNAIVSSSIADLYKALPMLKKSIPLDINAIGKFNYSGNVSITENLIRTKGNLRTAIGSLSTDVKIKYPGEKKMSFELGGSISNFEIGQLLKIDSLEKISATYLVRSDAKGIGYDASISSIGFNGYIYKDLITEGIYTKNRLETSVDINDKNLMAKLQAVVDFNDSIPRTLAEAEVFSSDLQKINLTSLPLQFNGKAEIDLVGDDPDNLNGIAKFSNLTVYRNNQAYNFDTLTFKAATTENFRSLAVLGKDIDASMEGQFTFEELPATLNQYFYSYYPLYFTKMAPPSEEFDLTFKLELKNSTAFTKILDNGISGFSYSKIEGKINTKEKLFQLDASIPKLEYNNLSTYDFELHANGDADSLLITSKTSAVVFNDSLSFPKNEIEIRSSKNISFLNINTFSEQSDYGAKLQGYIENVEEGIKVHFNPSTLVFNEKTWNIEKDGEVLISRQRFESTNFRLTNGDQSIGLITLPYEANSPQTIILTMNKVNLGELLPFVLKEPQIQGLTSGDLTIQDPFDKFKLYLNAQTEKTRFEDDSIGLTSLTGYWDNDEKRASFFFESDNPNYELDVRGKLNLKDSSNQDIDADINIRNVSLSLLEPYLGIVFSKMEGIGNGRLEIKGKLNEPDLIGTVKVTKAKVIVDYTQCEYTLQDPVIQFTPDKIDFGNIQMRDKFGNQAVLKGSLEHHFFNDFRYNINASSRKMLVLDTDREDNDLFFGNTVARFNFSITGEENAIKMAVGGAPVDSSTINILTTTSSKQSAEVDYIVWKTYGKEIAQKLNESSTNLIIDLDLSASPLLKLNVVLDEVTGDVLAGQGNGNLKIHTGTKEPLSMIGRFNISSGSYNFNFQDIFKKPFKLQGDGSSYISWNGDPFNAEINIDALYVAEKVRMSTLFTDPSSSTITGVSSDVLREISDVEVRCNLSGTLSKPNPTFQIVIPQNSAIKNNTTVDSKLKTINRDPLEVSKQATYLIVFKSFAPQAAIVANNMNSELLNTTISGVINGILANSVQNFFSRVLGSTVDVNFNYSRTLTNLTGVSGNSGGDNNFRENVSLQFIKSLMNDKLVITFGSDFNFATAGGNQTATGAQSFLFLPDVNVEYKITPDGKFRTSFFYRSNFDALSTSGKRDRTGGNISFRTEFDRFFEKKKLLVPENQ
jgi:hypothetical protein